MVAPTQSRYYYRGSRNYAEYVSYNVQVPPYNLRLPCRLWRATAYNRFGDAESWSIDENSSPLRVALNNKARERLVAKLGDTAQIGASIAAEWRGSSEMISSRCLQLFRFTNALRKGKLNKAATELGITTPSGARKKYKSGDFGSLWLEYSYGWSPLVSDIYGATKIIEKTPKDITIRGRSQGVKSKRLVFGGYPYESFYDESWTHKCQMIADIRVTNPNVYLGNQLGLYNPASWVLEAIPFSFVVDWFSNLSQWVSQLTDFLGCDVQNAATTDLVTCVTHEYLIYTGSYYDRAHKGFRCLRRTSGIPPVKLHFEYEVPNWKRGLNAISLLTQALRH